MCYLITLVYRIPTLLSCTNSEDLCAVNSRCCLFVHRSRFTITFQRKDDLGAFLDYRSKYEPSERHKY